jgi:hypothetical protein
LTRAARNADGASGASADGSRDAPRAFAFVHIPKSGGSTLTTRWTFLARQSDACVDRQASPALYAGSFELDPTHEFFPRAVRRRRVHGQVPRRGRPRAG